MIGKKVSIIILTYNNLHFTVECIKSIRTFTNEGEYEIIVVDNNSTDETRKWLKDQKDIKYILNDKNEGFPKGVNIGINATDGTTDILMLNNDTIVTPNWLEGLKRALYSGENIGAVGAVSNSVANQQDIQAAYKNIDEMLAFAVERNQLYEKVWENKVLLIGFCFLVKREVVNKVGVLDEIYTPGNYEDCDYSLRIIEEGYKLLLCHDVFIHHAGSATFRAFPEMYSFFGKNREKFDNKWGWDHGLVSDLRGDLIDLIENKGKLKVLEIGCGAGMNLIKLNFNNKECDIYGIEEVEGVSKIAEKLIGRSVYHKIEEYPYDYENDYFDYIIVGDTLSYVDNPIEFLQNVRQLVKNEGKILISVKNFAHAKNLKEIISSGIYSQFQIGLSKHKKRVKNLFMLQDIFNILGGCNLKLLLTAYAVEAENKEVEEIISQLKPFTKEDFSANYRARYYYIYAGK